jgi:thiamine biosynthesis protein ThiS
VKIRLNGADRDTSADTIAKLLEELHLPPQTLLVEINTQPLPRDQWQSTLLRENDSLEILRVSAGG